jgi:putative N6-adenine-specific DNA methylase
VAKPLELFVSCAPGVEPWLAGELASLGLTKTRIKAGGVSVKTKAVGLWRANLGAGLGLRVWKVLGRDMVSHFAHLEELAKRVAWPLHLPAGAKLRLDVHCRKSKLYHSGAVAERITRVLASGGFEVVDDPDALRIQIRIVRDQLRWAVDTSGAALHKRGGKPRTAKAPLRADLARIGLVLAGWEPGRPLLDPMMGSGTILLEAAAWAAGRPPGAGRSFAFEQAPGFDPEAYAKLRDSMRSPAVTTCIEGSDRDPGALASALANARDAGLESELLLAEATVGKREMREQLRGGVLVSNPPWGVRTGEESKLVGLYRGVGKLAQEQDMDLGLWSSRWDLLKAIRPPLDAALHTDHGGLKVTFARRARETLSIEPPTERS